MKNTHNHYVLALIKRVILERLKSLKKEVYVNELTEELGLEASKDLLERALKELEDEGYVVRLQGVVERTWALKQCDESWKPRGLRTMVTVNTPMGRDVVEALVIKGLETVEEIKPSNQVLALISRARIIAERAQTPRALHYARHLISKAIARALKFKVISKSQANKAMKSLELSEGPSKKSLLTAISRIEEMIKRAENEV